MYIKDEGIPAATVAQVNAGTSNSSAATPLNLHTSVYGAATAIYLFQNFI